MKKNIKVYENGQYIEKQINYIPLRYILAILITFLEVCSIIGAVVALAIFVPYFYIAIAITQVVSVVIIVVSKRTPDYKLTWLFFMTMLPVVGLMLFFIFQNRKIPKKYVKKLECVENSYEYNHSENFYELKKLNTYMASQAKSLCANSGGYLYQNTKLTYYPVGEKLQEAMLFDLKNAKKFIFLEYFIIEQGQFWDSLLNILVQKQSQGVEVKIVYDDIGCMGTLPGNYFKTLRKNYGFDVVLFSKLKGQADGEFNNRSHRKIMVLDGQVGFTGGVNIADEYINQNARLGHWKDTAIRLEGEAVNG
ncbi:MAG: PLDc N-terminal domain-containing protein, partial [Clostridia bacterium]|nr:PLDc N-terminal domain-containing protein [Clostridia bacterium]